MQADKKELDKDEKEKLQEASLNIMQDHVYDEMMKNLSKVEDPDRYYNWYYGYTQITFPYY